MHLTTRNVNTAFTQLVKLFNGDKYAVSDHPGPKIVKRPSRNGPVLMIDEPVMVTYERPLERVLFNTARDANPFLHLYEALWMLSGRNDVAPLVYYAKQFNEYSDDGKTLNGAYGYRWRNAKIEDGNREYDATYVDQLDLLVEHLEANPTSRRAVLQMWNVEDDLLKVGSMYSPMSKDVCCNTAVYFSLREIINGADDQYDRDRGTRPPFYALDMTVTNRSNDMIWGMLGANVVHFSFLQEYMAARLGVEVGRYTQMTNNLHVYESNWKPNEWLDSSAVSDGYSCHTQSPGCIIDNKVPLVKDPAVFEKELPQFVERHKELGNISGCTEPFLKNVADPLLIAFHWHKAKCYDMALEVLEQCKADDWRIAAINWIIKRRDKHDAGK